MAKYAVFYQRATVCPFLIINQYFYYSLLRHATATSFLSSRHSAQVTSQVQVLFISLSSHNTEHLSLSLPLSQSGRATVQLDTQLEVLRPSSWPSSPPSPPLMGPSCWFPSETTTADAPTYWAFVSTQTLHDDKVQFSFTTFKEKHNIKKKKKTNVK